MGTARSVVIKCSINCKSKRTRKPFKIGWMEFTNAVIRKISDEKEGVVFLLWGSLHRKNKCLIDETKHLVLKAAHPSPFSADKGFFGCRHFSKTNNYIIKQGKDPIDW
jgi:uracil-DNA glycosylase